MRKELKSTPYFFIEMDDVIQEGNVDSTEKDKKVITLRSNSVTFSEIL